MIGRAERTRAARHLVNHAPRLKDESMNELRRVRWQIHQSDNCTAFKIDLP